MKIKLKKLIVLLLISMLIISMSTVVRADDTQTQTQSSNGNFDVSSFDSGAQATKVDDLVNDASETVVAVMRIASVAISIVILLVIAMKYMISSAGDRADIKKHAVAYVVGTFILFAATQIIALLIDLADDLF